ncbi:hypothetical protein CRG98_024746 [Punica granatum]|uniref:Uncharacterized protein n=1 Tax=Punica granatum TaxID=22663 RepID=A0A2I0JFY3_PUNGR|nr:hypothetical protein CRG98_024746 [Punica granatum]
MAIQAVYNGQPFTKEEEGRGILQEIVKLCNSKSISKAEVRNRRNFHNGSANYEYYFRKDEMKQRQGGGAVTDGRPRSTSRSAGIDPRSMQKWHPPWHFLQPPSPRLSHSRATPIIGSYGTGGRTRARGFPSIFGLDLRLKFRFGQIELRSNLMGSRRIVNGAPCRWTWNLAGGDSRGRWRKTAEKDPEGWLEL